MKKSKVIVPALGLLLLSTAASISGSVAWFTATRTFNTTISDFTATTTDGALAVTMGAGVGTSVTANAVSLATDVKLGDASFNHTNGHLYTDTVSATTYKDLGIYNDEDVDTNWLVAGTTYYAVSWTMQFSYTFGADVTQQNLYLDPTSTMTVGAKTKDKEGEASELVEKGFRIAFVGETASATSKKVWSHLQTDANLNAFDYVASTSAKGNYNADVFSTAATGGSSSLVAVDAVTSAGNELNYLGKFTGTEGNTTTINFTCVAWFEGLDENVVTRAQINKVSAAMKFFVTPNA